MHVPAIEKPEHTACKHLCAHGCSIYADRPAVCSTWECAWRSGWLGGDERDRPDKLGVMFEYRLVAGRVFLWVYEVWPGALDDPKVQDQLSRLPSHETVVTSKHGSMELTAEPEALQFLAGNLLSGSDKPILPVQPVIDKDGHRCGTMMTQRVGNKFITQVVALEPGQRAE